MEKDRLNFLVLGGGAREHSIAYELSKSEVLDKLFLADANDGFKSLGKCLNYVDYEDLAQQVLNHSIDIVVIGPELPLALGIVDVLKKHEIMVVGTDSYWTQLESSKLFAKKFMQRHNIKTASFEVVTSKNSLNDINSRDTYVIKANGLCAGKGVFISQNRSLVLGKLQSYLDGQFAKASKIVLLEDFLEGDELSLICLFDGKTLLPFVPARDFKKLNSSQDAPNTGGMGAFCPVDLNAVQKNQLKSYVKNLESALLNEKADFCGFVYCGLIWVNDDFYTLEFNTRLGDPETQVILANLEYDFGLLLKQATETNLQDVNLKWKTLKSACLVLACDGYPSAPIIGDEISISENLDCDIFFAGIKKLDDNLLTNAGRVISLVCTDNSPFEKLYRVAKQVEFKHKYCRKDITCG